MSIDTTYAAIERRALAYGLVMHELGRRGLPSGGVKQQRAAADLHTRIVASLANEMIAEIQESLAADPTGVVRRTRDATRITELATVRDATNDTPDIPPIGGGSTRIR